MEGEFKNDELHGYGRSVKFHKAGHVSQYIGWWEEGEHYGWGKHNMLNGVVHEAYF